MKETINAIVAHEFNGAVPLRVRREYGGSVSQCFRVDLPAQSLFLKLQDDERACETEAHGLRALAETLTIRVPRVLCVGRLGNTAYLAMEYLSLTSRRSHDDDALLGDALGRFHSNRQSKSPDTEEAQGFGFDVDNFLGVTPQRNLPWSHDWRQFFRDCRLRFQVDLLVERGLCTDTAFLERVRRIIDRVDGFFDEGEGIQPSLLHGDLWQGNWGFVGACSDRQAVIFDPACYWGHSEADLAMMTLFGDVSEAFYASYFARLPKAKRFEQRVPLYQLYHALNHYNLFGRGYQSLCEELLAKLELTLEGIE